MHVVHIIWKKKHWNMWNFKWIYLNANRPKYFGFLRSHSHIISKVTPFPIMLQTGSCFNSPILIEGQNIDRYFLRPTMSILLNITPVLPDCTDFKLVTPQKWINSSCWKMSIKVTNYSNGPPAVSIEIWCHAVRFWNPTRSITPSQTSEFWRCEWVRWLHS